MIVVGELMIMVLMILLMRLLLAMMRMMVMMCGGTDYDNCNDGTDGKVSDEADVDSIFSPNILLFLVEKNQELSRDRKNICNSAL